MKICHRKNGSTFESFLPFQEIEGGNDNLVTSILILSICVAIGDLDNNNKLDFVCANAALMNYGDQNFTATKLPEDKYSEKTDIFFIIMINNIHSTCATFLSRGYPPFLFFLL